jgi:hypothetical protein
MVPHLQSSPDGPTGEGIHRQSILEFLFLTRAGGAASPRERARLGFEEPELSEVEGVGMTESKTIRVLFS